MSGRSSGGGGRPPALLANLDRIAAFDPRRRLRAVNAIARWIWSTDFESYSRFLLPGFPYLTGRAAFEHLRGGFGGCCGEKAAAFRYVLDQLGIRNRLLSAGPVVLRDRVDKAHPRFSAGDAFPVSYVRSLLEARSFAISQLPPHLWHLANEFSLDGRRYLVDVCGPVMRFLFVDLAEHGRMLKGRPRGYLHCQTLDARWHYHRPPHQLLERLQRLKARRPTLRLAVYQPNPNVLGRFRCGVAVFKDREELSAAILRARESRTARVRYSDRFRPSAAFRAEVGGKKAAQVRLGVEAMAEEIRGSAHGRNQIVNIYFGESVRPLRFVLRCPPSRG